MRALLLAAFTSALQPPRLTQRPQRPATRLYNTAEVEDCPTTSSPPALLGLPERGAVAACGTVRIHVLAPNEAAFAKLDDKRQNQLKDPRNGEVVEQIGAYHVISDPVSKDDLYESSGVVTAGGRIDVGRSVVGGFMGIGGKEDGGVTVNCAKIVSSLLGMRHPRDDDSRTQGPVTYFDQLRSSFLAARPRDARKAGAGESTTGAARWGVLLAGRRRGPRAVSRRTRRSSRTAPGLVAQAGRWRYGKTASACRPLHLKFMCSPAVL